MPFLLLLVLILACLWHDWPQPLAWVGGVGTPALATALTWLGAVGLVAAAAVLARTTCRRLRRDPAQCEAVLRRYRAWRSYHWLAQLAFYAVALFILGWGWAVQSLGPADASGKAVMLPGGELLLLAPLVATLLLSWACFYDVDRTLHALVPAADGFHPFQGRLAYVGFQARQKLALISIPLGLLILAQGLQWFSSPKNEDGLELAVIGLLAGAFVALPWILRLVLRLRPLPAGPLRDRLLAACGRLNFRCSNLLLWDTHDHVANAMVVGLVPWLRYVIFTDRLLHELSPDELEAVLGHEAGHVRHRHMPYYLGFLFISLAVVASLWALAAAHLLDMPAPADQSLEMLPLFAILGGYIFVVFGFLSRRCERQADIFGCRAVSCARGDCTGHEPDVQVLPGGRGLCPTGIRTFVSALEKVGALNGIHRHRPGWLQSWQHSTIARRVQFMERLLADPTLEPRFQRRVGLVKWGLLLALGAVLFILVLTPEGRAGLLGL
ncbi:MAG TPA: M48 family metallopeptidase [Gemmataceae bacterium]|nr:M48 family metallopeptidase [Gemmataceae bacterium]